ncbi:DUF4139 domain-containing protein [Planctomycetota bacterium]
MKHHLTEKELIEYRFRLAPAEQAGASAEHVAGCAECRERLEQLDRKFAALDLLKEDVHASEELIAQVMDQTKEAAKAKVVPFFTLRWIGAAAAVLIVGFVVFFNNMPTLHKARFAGEEKSEVAESARRSRPLDEALVDSKGRSMPTSEALTDSRGLPIPKSEAPTDLSVAIVAGTKVEEKAAVEIGAEEVRTRTFAYAEPKKGEALGQVVEKSAGFGLQPTKPDVIAEEFGPESIPEQPPFAPASAIELVTLPRRDNVQLTIYNASDSAPVMGERWPNGSGMMGGLGGGTRFEKFALARRRAGGLTNLIQEAIDPETWFDLSDFGEGTIQIHGNKLVVRQSVDVHRKVEKLLQAMRSQPENRSKGDSWISVDQRDTNRVVYQQLEQIVGLSELKPTTTFSDAIEVIRKSVDPPLKIVVLWKDLLEMAEIEKDTPIKMDGPAGVRLGAGLTLLLQANSSEFAELHYVVKDGVITIATVDSLPQQMETRVYDIAGLDSGVDNNADSDELVVEWSHQQDTRETRASQPQMANISNTLTLVRERRNLTLKRGWNWLQFMWANTLIDPTSLSLEPLEQAGKIDIQQLVFPARLRELGRWLIRSEISGQVPFEITYFTSGLSWRAFYMGTLSQDEKKMRLQGYVRVANSSGEDYENAQTRLLVGKVNMLDKIANLAKRHWAYGRPNETVYFGDEYDMDVSKEGAGVVITNGHLWGAGMGGYGGMGGMIDGLRRKEIRKEGLSEYFLYTIEGTETIPNEWGKRLLSFEAEDIAVESLYKYDEERWGGEAIRFVKFANDDEHNLGETPIPNGTVRIYGRADEQGFLSYVGGTDVKYIPVGDEIELNFGPARLVEIEPKLMDFKTDNYVFDNRGNISGWDEMRAWKIEMTNTRTLPVEVEITRGFDTAYWTLQSDMPYVKHDATHARFEVNLEPRGKQALEYVVTTYHGEREQTLTQ